jgi:hypothetical protein
MPFVNKGLNYVSKELVLHLRKEDQKISLTNHGGDDMYGNARNRKRGDMLTYCSND